MSIELATFLAILKGSTDLAKASKEIMPRDRETLQPKIFYHIKTVEVWSSIIQIVGMNEPVHTEKVTVPLLINSAPRTFVAENSLPNLTESDIISDCRNYVILGDPGSGKTTTVKRLIRKIIFEEPSSEMDKVNFPIRIIARELKIGQLLYREIADILGIAYEYREHGRAYVPEYSLSGQNTNDDRPGDYFYQNRRLENFIYEFLEDAKVLLFVDGLDEIEPNFRLQIESELERIARGNNIKIIVTCRSGDFGKFQMEGFKIIEIAPLSNSEIQAIVSTTAKEPSKFLIELNAAPYRDASNRPLFLVQLIIVFNFFGRLPPRPAEIYNMIISVSLEKWDRERKVSRRSQYAGFSSERKLEFLAALAFILTYQIKTKRFTREQLKSAYAQIHHRYRLPKNQADDVCKEIESHTGLLYESYRLFEFSHLSLQEYLCAYHMVRLPFDPIMVKYFVEYPAPIAVAISLSADPSSWMSALVYNTKKFSETNPEFGKSVALQEGAIIPLLSRIIVEGPLFTTLSTLGLSLIWLVGAIQSLERLYFSKEVYGQSYKLDSRTESYLRIVRQFFELEGVLDSIIDAFQRYYFDPAENISLTANDFIMRRKSGNIQIFFGKEPSQMTVKKHVVRFFASEYGVNFNWCAADGEILQGPLPF